MPRTSALESHPLLENNHLRQFFGQTQDLAVKKPAMLRAATAPALDHPLLKAFRQTEGKLVFTTPEGRICFLGQREEGEPDASWHLHDWDALDTILARGEMGMAETYIAGQWDSPDLAALLTYALNNFKVLENYFYGRFWFALRVTLQQLFKKNTLGHSRRNVLSHYDLGNDFYALWLDESMTYSCALFDGKERTLEEAQAAKYQRILDKLMLAPGSHVLDIGCGWGGFAEAAAKADLRVTGVTLSDAQKEFAEARMRRQQLDKQVEIHLQDYRKLSEAFDGIASIGMFEHVGERYWPTYFKTIKQRLKPGAKAMVQSIILNDEAFRRTRGKYGFIEQIIFPGGALPSREAFVEAAEKAGLQCLGTFTFGADYARTLRHWLARFEARKDDVKAMGYGEDFMRLWRFYLAACIASFESKRSSVMQAELTRA